MPGMHWLRALPDYARHRTSGRAAAHALSIESLVLVLGLTCSAKIAGAVSARSRASAELYVALGELVDHVSKLRARVRISREAGA